MHWLQENWFWVAPLFYSVACEVIAHSPLKSNTVAQLFLAAGKKLIDKKATDAK